MRYNPDHYCQLAADQLSSWNTKLAKLEAEQQGMPDGPEVWVRSAMAHAQHAAVLMASAPLFRRGEAPLRDARRGLGKALSCMEQVYVRHPLSSPSENLERLESLTSYPELTRYRDLRILGALVELLPEAYPSRDPRWLVGLHGLLDRHAVLLRNSAMLMGLRELLQQNNQLARARAAYANLAFRALRERAEAGRMRFESTRNVADMEGALRFCDSIIPLLTLLQREQEAQEFKKKREVWERRLNEEKGRNSS